MRRVVRAVSVVAILGGLVACAAGTRPPAEPESEDRRCSADSDCVFRPDDPCECDPCGTAWRRAVNQRAATDMLTEWAARLCESPECETCQTEWRGTEPACVAGQCSVRHTR